MTNPPRARDPVLMEHIAPKERRLHLTIEVDATGNITMEVPAPDGVETPLQHGIMSAVRRLCGRSGYDEPVFTTRRR
jgi:hypothetical protein